MFKPQQSGISRSFTAWVVNCPNRDIIGVRIKIKVIWKGQLVGVNTIDFRETSIGQIFFIVLTS